MYFFWIGHILPFDLGPSDGRVCYTLKFKLAEKKASYKIFSCPSDDILTQLISNKTYNSRKHHKSYKYFTHSATLLHAYKLLHFWQRLLKESL